VEKIVHSRNLSDWSHGTISNAATWNHLGAPAPAYVAEIAMSTLLLSVFLINPFIGGSNI
jgi:hypothetical protein